MNNLDLEYLRPGGSIGSFILLTGVLFTIMTLYVFSNVGSNADSMMDKKRKDAKKKERERKISRLYPEQR